jgi:hypothetical protein
MPESRPLTPKREADYRSWAAEAKRADTPAEHGARLIAGDLFAEIDRLRAALAEQREDAVAAMRKALVYCYRCGGGLVMEDTAAPYCEMACERDDGGDHPSPIDHLAAALRSSDA